MGVVNEGGSMVRMSILIFVALVAAACQKTQREELTIYTSLEESTARTLISAYEKETGTKVHYVRLSTGEAAARIETEKNRPRASLWLGGVGLGHSELKAKGLLQPYTSEVTKKLPAAYRDAEHYWNGLYLGVLAFVTNEKRIAEKNLEPPTSWADLKKAEWKGMIQLPNPGTSGTSYNIMTTLIDILGEEQAFDYLRDLHKNISQYTKSGSAPTKNVALGETALAVGYFHDMVRLTEETKAPLKISFPAEGTGYEIAAVSLLKDAPQLESAGKFVDWLYSQSASQIFANYFYVPLSQEGVELKAASAVPKDIKLIDTDIDWAGQNKQRLIDLWNSKVNI
jgi:iron(III) transport system substrate-binding protein